MTLSDWQKLGLEKPSGTDYEEHSAVGDLSTGRRFKATQIVPMKVLNATNASLTIYGFSKFGVNATEPLWRILAEDANGNLLAADGNDSFDNTFEDFGSKTFS